MKRRIASVGRLVGRWALTGLCVWVLFSLTQVLALRWVDPPLTVPMIWHEIAQTLGAAPSVRLRYEWVPLTAVSSHLRRAVLASEDQRFLQHRGFDLVEIGRAVSAVIDGERLRGASTISMQTARSVFLIPSRTIVRKALEAYYTVLIEALWNKRRILEMYLNTVDWGDGIYGAEAAARFFFKVSAGRLNPSQAALMAAVLPNPHRFSPQRPGAFLHQRQQRILGDMPGTPLLR
jgi:monofunctional biosynthetic peptidoglycan transglycosylase